MRIGWVVVKLVTILSGQLMAAPARPLLPQVPTLWFIGFSPKFADAYPLEFRQAVAYAIDREAVAKAVAATGVRLPSSPRPATTIQHPDLPGYDPTITGFATDPARAKELFQKSGRITSVEFLIRSVPGDTSDPARVREAIYAAVRESLERTLGLSISFRRVADFEVLVSAAKEGSAPAWLFGWAGDPRLPPGAVVFNILRDTVPDPEVAEAVGRGEYKLAQELVLRKAWLVPLVLY